MKTIDTAILVYIFILLPVAVLTIPAYMVDNSPMKIAQNPIVVAITGDTGISAPPSYSNTNHIAPRTITELNDALRVIKPPRPYKYAVFDCSEHAAYAEYCLENKGFDTTILGSLSEAHAWCAVHNIVGDTEVHIECVQPLHIKTTHPIVEREYNNITEAIEGEYPYEFNWWEC